MPDRERKRKTIIPTLIEARAVRLMGRPASWNGHGGRPLEHIPDKVLRKARAWFTKVIRDDGGTQSTDRMRVQRAAIDVVMHDRAAHAPQMELLPEIESVSLKPMTDDELIARVQADDADDGLPF